MTNTNNNTPENKPTMTEICTIWEDDIYEYVSGLSDNDIPDEYTSRINSEDDRKEQLHRYAEDLVLPVVRYALDYLESEYDLYFICEGNWGWTIYTCTTEADAKVMQSEFSLADMCDAVIQSMDAVPDDSAEYDVDDYAWTQEPVQLYWALDGGSLARLNLLDDDGRLRSKFTPDGSEQAYDTSKFIDALVKTVRGEINNLGYESDDDCGEEFIPEHDDPIGTLYFLACDIGVDRVYDHLQYNCDDIVDEAWSLFDNNSARK